MEYNIRHFRTVNSVREGHVSQLLEVLDAGVLVADGAMGTLLQGHGISFDHPYDYACVTHPDLVEEIHRDYLAAGARLIETNTYAANRMKLASRKLDDRVREINVRATALARRAAAARPSKAGPVLVAGSIGPLGRPIKPVGLVEPATARAVFREQAAALLEEGVDCFILETFADLAELKLAIEAVRDLADLPIIAEKTFIEDAETLTGGLPQRVAETLRGWGVQVMGANCTVGPQRMLQIVTGMAEVGGLPLSAMPTAGLPQLIDGQMRYECTPEYFARYGRALVEGGATLVGGCCGTTPAHIKALVEHLRGVTVRRGEAAGAGVVTVSAEERVIPTGVVETTQRSRLAQKLGKKYVVTVELDLPRGLDISRVLDGAEALRDQGCDCIDISDGARARLRMNPMVVAHLIQSRVGIEAMMHFCCRDRNLLATQADLLGAHALGIRNILAITGDPAQIGDYPAATSVFDLDSIGLVRILRRFNEGLDLAGNTISQRTGFLIAVAFNPLAADITKELDRLRQKADEGAELAYTQPIFERAILEFAVEEAGKLNLPLLVGILPLRSARHAEFMHNEVPGISVPEEIRRTMATLSDQDARRLGMQTAQEFLRLARPITAGAYLMPPFGSPSIAVEVMQALR